MMSPQTSIILGIQKHWPPRIKMIPNDIKKSYEFTTEKFIAPKTLF